MHGENRLAGNSLLECAVFGRIAGKRAAAVIKHADQPGTSSLVTPPSAVGAPPPHNEAAAWAVSAWSPVSLIVLALALAAALRILRRAMPRL